MIRIQNIYYMLAYAFQVLNEDSYKKVAAEEFEYVSDLFSAILAKGMFLICSPEVSLQRKNALKRVMLFFTTVDEVDTRRIQWSSIRYHRNIATYKMLINICYLVIAGMFLTEQDGSLKLARYLDGQHMHRLYEKFVLEYYRKHYPEFYVSPAYIDWNVDDGVIEFLPVMKTDITLHYQGKSLIIDTKYFSKTMQVHSLYNSRTLHSHNMYQIYTYVKNMDIANSGSVSGVLLYAKTDEEIVPDNEYMMGGSRVCVETLDLNIKFTIIADQLNN